MSSNSQHNIEIAKNSLHASLKNIVNGIDQKFRTFEKSVDDVNTEEILASTLRDLAEEKGLPSSIFSKVMESEQSIDLSSMDLVELIEKVKGLDEATKDQISVKLIKSDDVNDTCRFIEYHFSYEELLEVEVIEVINGREQKFLNKESVKDIGRIDIEQFHSCYASVENGKVNWLDGSRRRARALHLKCGLNARVALDSLSQTEAQFIANKIQESHKELSVRERGAMYKRKIEEGLSKGEVATHYGVSNATVTRSLKASEINPELLFVVSDISEITTKEWGNLYSLQAKDLPRVNQRVEEFVAETKASEEYRDLVSKLSSVTAKQCQTELIKYITTILGKNKTAPRKAKRVAEYGEEGKTHISPNGNAKRFIVEFGELEKEKQELLIEKIRLFMDEMHS